MKPAAESRINFSRLYTVEYNVKVATVGRIVHKDLELLDRYFREGVLKLSPAQDKDVGAVQRRSEHQEGSIIDEDDGEEQFIEKEKRKQKGRIEESGTDEEAEDDYDDDEEEEEEDDEEEEDFEDARI
jgi:hypothetical protein